MINNKSFRKFEEKIECLINNPEEINKLIKFTDNIIANNESFFIEFVEFLYERRNKEYKKFNSDHVMKLLKNIEFVLFYLKITDEKQYDVISLFKKIKIELIRIKTLIIETDDTFEESIDSAKEEISKYVEDEIKKQESKVANITTQVITILSIFTAIVITFFGGISFANSSLSFLSKVSLNQLLIIVGIEGAVLFNLAYLLFAFICKIIGKDLDQLRAWKSVNSFLCIIVFVGIICSSFKVIL